MMCGDRHHSFPQVFTERPDSEMPTDRLGPDLIVDYLARFPEAVIIYLEYQVIKKQSQVCCRNVLNESYHVLIKIS